MTSLPLSLASLPSQVNRLILAYSGGLDSSVLLHALTRQSQYPLAVWHINHGLQDNASDMESFAREQAKAYEVPCQIDRVHLKGGENLEARAREARYQLFRDNLMLSDALVTAHHMNDQAETLLLNLLRGSGPDGLSAMAEITALGPSRIFRPLLGITRRQLEQYASDHELTWIDDPSNQDSRFDRNYLRHQVLPVVSERWSAAIPQIHRVAEFQQEAALLARDVAKKDFADAFIKRPFTDHSCLKIDAIKSLQDYRKKNLIRHWIQEQGLKPFGFRKQQELLHQLDAQSIHIGAPNYSVRKFQGALYLVAGGQPEALPELVQQPDLSYSISGYSDPVTRQRLVQACAMEDLGQSATLYLRTQSDCPTGFAHRLKRLYAKHQVPPWVRDRVPMIYLGGELRGLLL